MELTTTKPILTSLGASASYFTRPARILRGYQVQNLRADLIAGLTIAVILLPQAIAYAMIAELPPAMGIYAAVVAAIVGALWGSSAQLHTGPTNAASLLVLATLVPIVAVGTPGYLAAAGLLAVMVGIFRMLMGVFKLGMLVNFVSDSVIVGFTAGAGILISFNQLRHLFGLSIPSSPELISTIQDLITHIPETNLPSLVLGLATLIFMILMKRFFPTLPAALLGIIGSAAAVAFMGLDQQGVQVIGELPKGLPPLAKLPLFDFNLITNLSAGAMAIAAIGLVEAMSIARSISSYTGQRLDSNQEFVGQGLANIACGFLSGYTTSGSFTRTAVNYESGGKTALSSVFSGLFVLVAVFFLAPYATYVPRTALAAVLIVTAYGMVDRKEMVRIWNSTRGDAAIMAVTLFATLFLPLQFAVLTGILMSLAYYLLKTSTPVVLSVLPDDEYKHLEPRPDKPQCPQMAVLEVRGDLYFGAVNHVEEMIFDNQEQHPGQRFLALRMQNVQHIDISGIHALEAIVRKYRDQGGDVYISKMRPAVQDRMQATGFETLLGEDHFLDVDEAIPYLFHRVLDPAICIYECEIRAFLECQNLPRPTYHLDLPSSAEIDESKLQFVSPEELHHQLAQPDPPMVIDVREPREFKRGHIPQAENIPLPQLITHASKTKADLSAVLVCRTGRRSRRVAQALCDQGCTGVQILAGGMINWESANLLEAVEILP